MGGEEEEEESSSSSKQQAAAHTCVQEDGQRQLHKRHNDNHDEGHELEQVTSAAKTQSRAENERVSL